MSRKMDRFEAMVARSMPDEWQQETLRLLRRERAALVRAAKRLRCIECKQTFLTEQCLIRKLDVLALLAQRKGKKQ